MTTKKGQKKSQSVTLLHFGRSVPKELKRDGWVEAFAVHLGKGTWMFKLRKVLK